MSCFSLNSISCFPCWYMAWINVFNDIKFHWGVSHSLLLSYYENLVCSQFFTAIIWKIFLFVSLFLYLKFSLRYIPRSGFVRSGLKSKNFFLEKIQIYIKIVSNKMNSQFQQSSAFHQPCFIYCLIPKSMCWRLFKKIWMFQRKSL